MDPQAFKLKFKYDTTLLNTSDAEIADALEEAGLVVTALEFGDLKERAVGLYAAHILRVAHKSKSGNSFSDASSMTIAGQSVSFSRSGIDAFYNQSIYGQRYLALKNSIPVGNDGTNPNRIGVGAFVV